MNLTKNLFHKKLVEIRHFFPLLNFVAPCMNLITHTTIKLRKMLLTSKIYETQMQLQNDIKFFYYVKDIYKIIRELFQLVNTEKSYEAN